MKCPKNLTLLFFHLGLELSADENGFTIHQIQYVHELNLLEINEARKINTHDEVTADEKTGMRSAIGKLNWLTGQTRPDIAFEVSVAASKVHQARIRELIDLNKLIKKTKSDQVIIKFPMIKDIENSKLVVYSDASFGNLDLGGSQGAYVIFIVNQQNNAALIAWKSHRIKRIVRSTLAAETLALSDAVDFAYMINIMISKLVFSENVKLNIECRVDSRSLVDSVKTTHTVTEKRLLIDLSALRQALDRQEINIEWIETQKNLANPLTKKTSYSGLLLQAIKSGSISF